MKVRETLSQPANVTGLPGKDERKVSDSREAGFQTKLRRVEERNVEERINELVGKIMQQGEKLGEKVDVRELKIYKNLISEFLEEAVSNSHRFSKESFLDRRGRYKVYATIKSINKELELLTKDILSAEKDNVRILQRLDDIRGLILDITL